MQVLLRLGGCDLDSNISTSPEVSTCKFLLNVIFVSIVRCLGMAELGDAERRMALIQYYTFYSNIEIKNRLHMKSFILKYNDML